MSVSIYNVSVDDFIREVKQNIASYAYICKFWLPIIEERIKHLSHYAEDCLLNPIFCWCYLGTVEKLEAFEQELLRLENILGVEGFSKYQKNLMIDMSGHSIENQVHNRMLEAYSEIHGMFYYHNLDYSISIEPQKPNQKTHDFNAFSDNSNIAVEAKSIRLPDKLEVYLMRWWHAQADVGGKWLLGLAPQIKFKWGFTGRADLTQPEICAIKKFFHSVFEEPDSDKKLCSGRINISYSPNNTLPPALTPLGTIPNNAKHPVDKLKEKLNKTIEGALKQLSSAKDEEKQIACYLELNIDPSIPFEYNNYFNKTIECLKADYSRKTGLDIIVKKVSYL